MKHTLTIIVFSIVCSYSFGATVFSNFASPEPFNPGVGTLINYEAPTKDKNGNIIDPGSYHTLATGFTVAGSDFSFDSLRIPILYISGAASLSIRLASDTGFGPGSTIETLSYASPNWPISAPIVLSTLNSATHPILEEGNKYWIVAEIVPGVTTSFSWAVPSTTPVNKVDIATMNNESGIYTIPWMRYYDYGGGAFQISGTAVPEPSVISLLILAFPLLIFIRKRAQQDAAANP